MIYLDTSSLVALYFPESRSARVQAQVRQKRSALAFTWLHEVEFTNGLQLKLFRREAVGAQVAATLEALKTDLSAGIYVRASVDWPHVFEETRRLSVRHSSTAGTRTLDLLHVAAATFLHAKEFITSDKRQAAVARKEGLTVTLVG